MDPICRLGTRCLKKDEPLEVAENEWEGLLFHGKQCFNNNKKVLQAASIKHKGRVPLQTDGPTPEINLMVVIIDWLTKEGNYN